MGGSASKLPAAPNGYYPLPGTTQGEPVQGHHYTGKIAGIVYDPFGDFEGFLLATEAGYTRRFKSTEPGVEALIRRAWEERTLLTVRANRHHPERISSIVLRKASRSGW